MKLNRKPESGIAFILVFLVIIVTSIWISSLALMTKVSADFEGRRITMNETLSSADGSLERAWGRWRDMSANGSTLPTNAQMNSGWTDAMKVYTDLNPGVSILPTNVTLKQIDSVGRYMKDDASASVTAKTDVSRGLVKRSVSYVASVMAEGASPVGATTTPVKVRVNRVFEKSDIPLFQYLAFFDHTLHLHNGPNMKINGKLHSNFRVVATPGQWDNGVKTGTKNGLLTIRANISGPEAKIGNQKKSDLTSNSAIAAAIEALYATGDKDIVGFYEDTQVPYNWNGLGSGSHLRNDEKTTLTEGASYQGTGKLNLFDPNDTEYMTWWADDPSNPGKQKWETTTNNNINGGFRELIEKPVTNSDGQTFPSGNDDTLFIAAKRFYNQADLKIEYRSELTTAEKNANMKHMVYVSGSSGPMMYNPDLVKIYYKSGADAVNIPNSNDPNYATKKTEAIKEMMKKTEITGTFKTDILKAMAYAEDKFYDRWVNGDLASSNSKYNNGLMDVMDVDMAKLRPVLDAWLGSGNYGAPTKKEGVIMYITDTSSGFGTAVGRGKGVRIINGQQLPSGGFTMATDMLAYVRGDYNTGSTDYGKTTTASDANRLVKTNVPDPADDDFSQKNYDPNANDYLGNDYLPEDHPSAILADNIRLQSNAWVDTSNNTIDNNDVRTDAQPTTYNFAMVMGDKYNDAKQFDTGGLHNFPRFMEDWSGKESTIIGSFIQLWTSKYINASQGSVSNAYNPPLRNWGFAGNYLFRTPPGSLDAIEYTRGRYWFSGL